MTADEIITEMQKSGRLPAKLTDNTVKEIGKSLSNYFGDLGKAKVTEFTDKAKEIAEQMLKVTEEKGLGLGAEGETATGRGLLGEFLAGHGAENIAGTMNIEFFLRVPEEVAMGAGKYIRDTADPEMLDEFPAMEFTRVYQRDVPRGSEKDPAGPDNAWDDDEGRWVAACEEAGDDKALEIFQDTGRCVALKASGVWQALGDGAGGYSDTLGNPFPPFAFNSGWETSQVPRPEAEELGLLEPGEEAEEPDVDFGELLGLDSRRSVLVSRKALSASATSASHGKGCLMAIIPNDLAKRIIDWANQRIPVAALAGYDQDGNWNGLEGEPHVTVLYGFEPGFDIDRLAAVLKDKPVVITLGKVSRFECPDYDVLKLDIDSIDCENAHKAIAGQLEDVITPSQHAYHPHLTLAYLKHGALKELDGLDDFEGMELTVNDLLYSEPEETNRKTLPLS